MSSLKIEAGKKYRTRGGDEVEVLRTDVNSDESVVGIVTDKDDGSQWVATYRPDGSFFFDAEDSNDIISEIKPKRVMWVNVHSADGSVVGVTSIRDRAVADTVASLYSSPRIACVRVEFEEGQFDDDE